MTVDGLPAGTKEWAAEVCEHDQHGQQRGARL